MQIDCFCEDCLKWIGVRVAFSGETGPHVIEGKCENCKPGAITGDQVRVAAVRRNITKVHHHNCGICRMPIDYVIEEGQLYLRRCRCDGYAKVPKAWIDAAGWINLQSKPQVKKDLAGKFGLTLRG